MNQVRATIAALAILASARIASAAPVFFVNPEGTDRHTVSTFLEHSSPRGFIDVSKPASRQPASGSDPLPGSAFSWAYVVAEPGNPVGGMFGGAWNPFDLQPFPGFALDPTDADEFVVQFNDLIGAGDEIYGDAPLHKLAIFLSGNAPGFLGLRFAIWNEAGTNFTTHFGWMQVDWLGEGLTGGVDLDILAWGFETEPDTPIAAGAIPAPGGAGLLALAGAFTAQRRRRG